MGYSPFTHGIEDLTPTSGTCPNKFSIPIDQDIHTQCALSRKIVVLEWRSMIAVSLNVGGGFCLIKPAKLYMCRQTHYKHDEDGPTLPSMHSHGSVLLSHSGNVVTRIGLHTHKGSHCLLIYIILILGTFYKILKLLNCRICSISCLSHLQLLEMEMT